MFRVFCIVCCKKWRFITFSLALLLTCLFAYSFVGPRIELWHSEEYIRQHWLSLLKAWNKQQADSGRRSQRSAASKAKQILRQTNDGDDDDEEEGEVKKDVHKSAKKSKKTKKSNLSDDDDDDDFSHSDGNESEYSQEETNSKKRSASKKGKYNSDDDDDNDDDNDDEIVISKSKKRKSIVIIDDENDENDTKKSNRKKAETPSQSSNKSRQSSRSSSGRAQLLNSKQEQKRLDAMEELRLIKLKGLSALSSSDDGEYENSNDESSVADVSPARSKPKPRATLSPYKDDFFDKKTPKSSQKRVTPKGLGLPRPLSPQPVYEEEDESDIDNFILNSDEEREEEEQRLAALEAKREKEKRRKKKMKLEKEKARKELRSQRAESDDDEDDDGLMSKTISAKKRRRSIIVDDEDGEDEEEDEEDEDEEDEDEEDEDEDEEDDDDDDDDLEDGPLTYLQVDLMRDERRESMEFTLRKSYTRQEAMKIYIEMLARTHVDPDFIASLVRDPESPSSVKYSTAARQLENVICTSRESLLGSGAWNKEFVSELQARPFYMMNKINPEQAQCERCLACNRKNDHLSCKAYLCGPRYDAKRAWTGTRWDREVPSHVFVETNRNPSGRVSNTQNIRLSQQAPSSDVIELSDDDEAEGGNDDDEDDDENGVDKEVKADANKLKYWFHKYKWPQDLLKEKETKWELGSRCFSRSQLYHNLMHYKFHLLLKVKKKLLRYDKNVDALCSDIAFISQETDRYVKLLEETHKGYGGNEHRGYKDLWNDDDDDPVLETTDSSRPLTSMTQSSGGGNSLLRWLGRNNNNNQKDEIVDD